MKYSAENHHIVGSCCAEPLVKSAISYCSFPLPDLLIFLVRVAISIILSFWSKPSTSCPILDSSRLMQPVPQPTSRILRFLPLIDPVSSRAFGACVSLTRNALLQRLPFIEGQSLNRCKSATKFEGASRATV